ncbi:hypothetical protein [Xanthovirga aplysinae]|uniref:DUF7935 family protein n=1 Tax=Xanthovirga aplysinae TaxID=2529853 RepID=UPI0012BC0DA5|nr:hypothetical protein [Xanthovirga aplysinae]MTI33369.1 hypothetical protein [Xanthovirga aplysinae]
MEVGVELLKLILPAGLVLYAMYLTVKSFLNKEIEDRKEERKKINTQVVMPIRLQAYERISLLLERISPDQMLTRLNDKALSAIQFRHVLISEIRQEFNHNLSQQIYMSDSAWNLVKSAVEELIIKINQLGEEMPAEAGSTEFSRKLIEEWMQVPDNAINSALIFLKDEIRRDF